jgi:hypothetical protein
MTGNPKNPSVGGDAKAGEENIELDAVPELEQEITKPALDQREHASAPAAEEKSPSANARLELDQPVSVTLKKEENQPRRRDEGIAARAASAADINQAIYSNGGTSWFSYLLIALAIGGVVYAGLRFYRSAEKIKIVHMPTEDQKPLPLSKQVVGAGTALPNALAPLVPVTIKTDQVGFELFVNGSAVATVDNQFEAPEGRLEIMIRKIGYEPYVTTLVATNAGENVVQPQFAQEKPKGFLAYETTPDAKLMLFQGEKLLFEKNTPFTGFSLPAGKYRAVLENTLIGFHSEEEIEITAWQTTVRRKNLQANSAP